MAAGTREEADCWADSLRIASRRSLAGWYEVGPLIGEGLASRVHLGIARDSGERVAIRVLRKDVPSSEALAVLRGELALARVVPHRSVLRTLDIFHTRTAVYVVLEYMAGGTLDDQLAIFGKFSELTARPVMEGLLSALHHLHSHNVVHRNVTPNNVLLEDRRHPLALRLGDFAHAAFLMAKRVNQEVMDTPVGTPHYVASEITRKQRYGPAVDLWSAGVLMYRMLSGTFPFDDEDDKRVIELVRIGDYSFPADYFRNVSADAKSLLRQLLQRNPSKRTDRKSVV